MASAVATPITNIAKIYKICSDRTDLVFIGSTQRELNEVFDLIGEKFRNWKRDDDIYSYYPQFDILMERDARIELIREVEFIDIDDLREHEEFVIDEYDHCINKVTQKRRTQTRQLCECGGRYCNTKSAQKIHEKTKKHLKYLAGQEAVDEILNMVRDEESNESDYSSDE